MRLSGKVALVTGGARGIGGATAELLARDGARVAIADLRRSEAEETLGRITSRGGEAFFVETDVTNDKAVQRLVGTVVDRWGQLDVLVHAAGILKGAMLPVDALEPEIFDEVVAVNLRGAFLFARHAVAAMRPRRSGVVLLIASGAGVRGGSSSVAYGSSKGGVHGLALVLGPQLEPHGIRVHAICPGSLATELKLDNVADVARAQGADPEAARERARHELGDPAGVGRVLTWLASDEADYVRGTVFTR